MPVLIDQDAGSVSIEAEPLGGFSVAATYSTVTIDSAGDENSEVSITLATGMDLFIEVLPDPASGASGVVDLALSGPPETVVVLDYSMGPKGDPGSGSGGGGDWQRVNTDISGVWGAPFYVEDANSAGDWRIKHIDGLGNRQTATSANNPGYDVATAWAARASLNYV